MLRQKFLVILTLAVLICMISVPASAEILRSRTSRGNNLGVIVECGWGMPWGGSGRPWQFPKGSGNYCFNDGMTIAVPAAIDKDGDGEAEDTTGINHMRAMMPGRASLEAYDLIMAAEAEGQHPNSVMDWQENNRVWSSLDADELAAWPIEGRIGHTASGAPNVASAGETMFFHSQDVWVSWGFMCPGGYYAWTLRFLDFGESNNMMYGNIYYRNMSEYMKYNPSSGYASNAVPGGWTYKSAIVVSNHRSTKYGSSSNNNGWMYHPERRITGIYPDKGPIAGFTPSVAPMIAYTIIIPPSHNDEVMDLKSYHVHEADEFGYSGTKQAFVGETWGFAYRYGMNLDQGLYPGSVNPFHGREVYGAWPGRLEPTDDRFNQWLWGGASDWMHYTTWGEVHDLAPRDSLNWDFAYMLTYPGVDPLDVPDYDLDNIDDAMMQDAFAPLEVYHDVADIVVKSGFKVPSTPTAPELTIIPGDRQVTITWSDINLQTPDAYYYFLEENNINQDGHYLEYDFEGFRVYRSFVGPNDSHLELLEDFNKSAGNLQFFYIDKLEDDKPLLRMRNGMKVWYAVVPYDKNYDPSDGSMFSLPDPSSGKTWNRAGEALYTLTPRSEASEFRPASLGAVAYVGSASVDQSTLDLAGDGSGKLTEAPQLLIPQLGFTFEPVNNERINNDVTVQVGCTGLDVDWGCAYWARPERIMSLLDASGNVIMDAPSFKTRDSEAELVFMDVPEASGVSFALTMLYNHPGSAGSRDYAPVYIDFDMGSYTGADVANKYGSCVSSRVGTGPSIGSYIRTGVFQISWSSAGSDMTVSVSDVTRGEAVAYSPYPDDLGWGFMPAGTYMDFYNEQKAGVAKADRANLMLDKIPADNTDEFAIWINGIVWAFTNISAMPSSGSVFTVTNCFGKWNGDQTVFTQYADAPFPGEKWQIGIKASTLNPEDADLQKVKVVPNPYIVSSFLDMSSNSRRLEFINLPSQCTIRIYTLSGNLVNVLNHVGSDRNGWGNYTDWDRLSNSEPAVYTGYDNHSGTEPWNMRNRFGQTVASGLYFFHVTDQRGEENTGMFYIIN
jgi:hypothetical protein